MLRHLSLGLVIEYEDEKNSSFFGFDFGFVREAERLCGDYRKHHY